LKEWIAHQVDHDVPGSPWSGEVQQVSVKLAEYQHRSDEPSTYVAVPFCQVHRLRVV
jgi:hypothetical protein